MIRKLAGVPVTLLIAIALVAVACGDGEAGDAPADGNQVSSGVLADGGLMVEEALATDATGVLAVRGFIVADDTGAQLCDAQAESLPPLCGGATIDLASLDGIDPSVLEEAQGVRFSNQPIVVFGEIVDGTLVPNPLVSG